MTPEEKSVELFQKYYKNLSYIEESKLSESHKMKLAVESAIFAVNEIINALQTYDETTEDYLKEEKKIDYMSCELQNMESDFRFWEAVKKKLYNFKP